MHGQGHYEIAVVLPGVGPITCRLDHLGVPYAFANDVSWLSYGETDVHRIKQWSAYSRRLLSHVQVIRSLRPDVVVTNTVSSPWAAFSARLLRKPHIWFIHELMTGQHGSFPMDFHRSARLISHLSAAVAVNSQTTLERFVGPIPLELLHVAEYAVEIPEGPRFSRQGALRAVLAGMLTPGKHVAEAISAVATLAGAVHLRILGDGPERGSLEALAAELGAQEWIRFEGWVAEPWKFYADADVLVTSSRDESFGRVVVEALKAGIPVVTADSGAPPLWVTSSTGGFTYPPGDVGSLAATLLRLSTEAPLVQELGQRGRTWARHRFTTEAYVASFEEAVVAAREKFHA